jgi:hypothetical protein
VVPSGYEVASHCSFDKHFPRCWESFHFLFLFCVLYFAELWFELRALRIVDRWHSITWVIPQPFFAFRYFSGKAPQLVSEGDPLTYNLLYSWGDRCEQTCPVYLLRWGLTNFLPGLPSTPCSFLLPGIIGMSQCAWPLFMFLLTISVSSWKDVHSDPLATSKLDLFVTFHWVVRIPSIF